MYRVAYRLRGCWVDAEDVVHQALVKTRVAWRRTRHAAGPRAAALAADAAMEGMAPTPATAEAAGADRVDESIADRLLLADVLQTLPRNQREVFVMRYLADFSEEDVARALGCSVDAVKERGDRGLQALQEQINRTQTLEGVAELGLEFLDDPHGHAIPVGARTGVVAAARRQPAQAAPGHRRQCRPRPRAGRRHRRRDLDRPQPHERVSTLVDPDHDRLDGDGPHDHRRSVDQQLDRSDRHDRHHGHTDHGRGDRAEQRPPRPRPRRRRPPSRRLPRRR